MAIWIPRYWTKPQRLAWRAPKEVQASLRVTSNRSVVVTHVLSKSFLKEGAPKRQVVSNMGKERVVCSIPLLKGQPVVDDHSVGHSKRLEIDCVDTSLVLVVALVDKDLLEATRLLCKSDCSSEEPAVADIALIDVLKVVLLIVAPDRVGVVVEGSVSSSPSDAALTISEVSVPLGLFLLRLPNESLSLVTKVSVSPCRCAIGDVPVVGKGALGTIDGSLAFTRGHTPFSFSPRFGLSEKSWVAGNTWLFNFVVVALAIASSSDAVSESITAGIIVRGVINDGVCMIIDLNCLAITLEIVLAILHQCA